MLHQIEILIIICRQKLLITGFCLDDSQIGADVYEANLKNALADITAIHKDPPIPTDEYVTSEFENLNHKIVTIKKLLPLYLS